MVTGQIDTYITVTLILPDGTGGSAVIIRAQKFKTTEWW